MAGTRGAAPKHEAMDAALREMEDLELALLRAGRRRTARAELEALRSTATARR